ncbi:SRPBCC domain-containing protein [Sphingomonas sp. MMS24-J13]|uniref:SRPBCC domain-containing protein n=1 Tax=Sphingomonas sp. MMS24-J13 TaxID=3238686 RepID=UPI00384F1F2C
MPATTERTSGFEIDRAAHTIRFTRDFAVDPATVFAAWTRPEHLTHWWDSTGKPLTRCEIDLRVGGAFAFTVHDYPDMPFAGTYHEIVANERIVFDAIGAIGRVMLEATGGGTRMTVEIVCSSAEHLDQFVQMGVQTGTAATLDNLVAYLGTAA